MALYSAGYKVSSSWGKNWFENAQKMPESAFVPKKDATENVQMFRKYFKDRDQKLSMF